MIDREHGMASSQWWNVTFTAVGAAFSGPAQTGQREQRQNDTHYVRDRADRFEQHCRDVAHDMARHAQHRQMAMGTGYGPGELPGQRCFPMTLSTVRSARRAVALTGAGV